MRPCGCSCAQVETCRWLLERGIDFTLVNQAGHTAVHKAAWKGHKACLEWMLVDAEGPHLAYQLRMLAADDRTPADKARVNGHAAVATWLLALETQLVPLRDATHASDDVKS